MASDLKPVYLLSGSDRPKIARALERLRGRFPEDSVEHLSAASASGEEVVAACNSLGLFGDGSRLVLVTDVERWKAADAKAVASYLGAPTPGTVLALQGEEVKKDSALAKACAKAGDLLLYEITKRDLPRWVQEQFGRLGAKVTAEVCRRLVEVVGEDAYELEAEIEKLATWAGGDEIRQRDVELVACGHAETSGFQLTDAWGARDVRAVLAAAEALLEQASDSRREETRIAGLLNGHAARLRECQELDAAGVPPREAATRLKRHPFYVEKLFRQAANFSVDELRDAIVRLAQLDVALKGGSRLSGQLELELALVEITRRAEPHPATR
jgi:DNA polymerase III subunit delta